MSTNSENLVKIGLVSSERAVLQAIVKKWAIASTLHKNSSGDEIANVNFYAVRPGSYQNLLK